MDPIKADGQVRKIAILAGETSGDLLGSHLIDEILRINPSIEIHAVSGPKMRTFPIHSFYWMENLQVMGFIDVFLSLPKILKSFWTIYQNIQKISPDVVVFIDYPGLHLRLAQKLRKNNFSKKLIHFICPSVWAWGKNRIPKMEKNLNALLTLFPFESACFQNTEALMKVFHVGHPLMKKIADEDFPRENLLGIFPGSREHEIHQNLPLFLQVASHLKKEDPSLKLVLSIANPNLQAIIDPYIKNLEIEKIPPEKAYSLMRKAKFCLATSGTVTLELALHKTPTIVGYAIRKLDQFLALHIFKIRLPFYCIVNILKNELVFPEFFGSNFLFSNLLEEAKKMNQNAHYRKLIENKCKEVRNLLGDFDPSQKAAQIILQHLSPQ